MRILLCSVNYAPEMTGIGKYSGEMSVWLRQQGHDVRVICAPPYYPGWKVQRGYRADRYIKETISGVNVWRAPIWIPAEPTGIARLLHLLSFALSIVPLMIRQISWKPDIVMTVAPALACAPAAAALAKVTGAKSWLHVQDFEVDVAFKMGFLSSPVAKRMALAIERWLMSRFDVVSTISTKMFDKLLEKGLKKERAFLFPNWVDTQAVRPLTSPSKYRSILGIPESDTVCLFSGTWGNKQGLMVIPRAAELLQEVKTIHFVIAGDGVMRPAIESATKCLPNVKLLPLQPASELNELLGLADIHILPQSPEAEDLVLPSKLTGMLSSGRCIVATCRPDTEIAQVIADCGVVTPPEDPEALAAALLHLHQVPNKRAVMGEAARKFSDEQLSMTHILRRVEKQLNNICVAAGRGRSSRPSS